MFRVRDVVLRNALYVSQQASQSNILNPAGDEVIDICRLHKKKTEEGIITPNYHLPAMLAFCKK